MQSIKSKKNEEISENFLFNLSIDERIKTKTTGLVVRIGFQTLKGGLIKDILFQESLTFNFV